MSGEAAVGPETWASFFLQQKLASYPCSIREIAVDVSQLLLGYMVSDLVTYSVLEGATTQVRLT